MSTGTGRISGMAKDRPPVLVRVSRAFDKFVASWALADRPSWVQKREFPTEINRTLRSRLAGILFASLHSAKDGFYMTDMIGMRLHTKDAMYRLSG